MFNQTLSTAVSSLIPYWSNNIVKYLDLGNEYSMAVNMLITETIRYVLLHLTDIISVSLVIISFTSVFLQKYKYFSFNWHTYNTITLIGKEDDKHIIYSKAMKCINNNTIANI